jgi:hypothetical protein
MTIDLERLAVDADYWDEVAPEGATHFMYSEKFVKWVDGVELSFYVSSERKWKKSFCSWSLQQYIDCGNYMIAKPDAPELMPDNCLAARIGEIGNQAHNLACDYQNDENLSEKISKIASGLWDLAKKATIEPAASKPHPTDTQPTESGAQISAEWDGEGLPPVGIICDVWHLKKTWRRAGIVAHVMSVEGEKAVWQLVDYSEWGGDLACNFRPIRSQAEREREELATFLEDYHLEMGSYWCPEKEADYILSSYDVAKKARGES